MDESTAAGSADEGSTPATETEGSKPDNAGSTTEARTFDEAYVKHLRKESAGFRTELAKAQERLRELEDRDKTEAEKLTTRATESERRASVAETRLLRFEIATTHGLDHEAAQFLTGDTPEEIEERATKLAEYMKARQATSDSAKPVGGFDGGARERPADKGTPEQEHASFLLGVIGRPTT